MPPGLTRIASSHRAQKAPAFLTKSPLRLAYSTQGGGTPIIFLFALPGPFTVASAPHFHRQRLSITGSAPDTHPRSTVSLPFIIAPLFCLSSVFFAVIMSIIYRFLQHSLQRNNTFYMFSSFFMRTMLKLRFFKVFCDLYRVYAA